MRLAPALLLLAIILGGCATAPPASAPNRDRLADFALEARFALRATPPGQAPQSASGRLSWLHRKALDRILLASPLGYGIAEIEVAPDRARLQTARGERQESNDPDALIEEATGQRLPVARIPAWLLGRPKEASALARDVAGRPSRLSEDGWVIEYAYDDERPDALPARVNIGRPGEIELKLRIEDWREAP